MSETVARQITKSEARSWLDEFGSPLFVLHKSVLKDRLQSMRGSAKQAGLNAGFYYSYKTNPITAICQLAHQCDYGAEVVSESELNHAIKLGISGHQIIYNGPYKSEQSIAKAWQNGALIHADSIQELRLLKDYAERSCFDVQIGIRLQVDIGNGTWSKFGVKLEDLVPVLREDKSWFQSVLSGLHIHIGTNICDLEVYRTAIGEFTNAVRIIEDLLGSELAYLDMGGGLAAGSATPLTELPGSWRLPDIASYFKLIAEELDRSGYLNRKIIFEHGRWLVASCLSYFFQIHSIKSIGNRSIAITDGNVNHVPSAYYLRHHVTPLSDSQGDEQKIDLYGPTCTQFDGLGLDVKLKSPKSGDILSLEDVGAYTISFSNQFTASRPAVVMQDENGVKLIRKREASDAFWQDDIPLGALYENG